MLNYPCGAVGDPNAPYNQAESESVTITASLTIEKGRKLTHSEIMDEFFFALQDNRADITIEEI
jgi:hypothetical protein